MRCCQQVSFNQDGSVHVNIAWWEWPLCIALQPAISLWDVNDTAVDTLVTWVTPWLDWALAALLYGAALRLAFTVLPSIRWVRKKFLRWAWTLQFAVSTSGEPFNLTLMQQRQ